VDYYQYQYEKVASKLLNQDERICVAVIGQAKFHKSQKGTFLYPQRVD
jgi:hypothetical protein